MPDRPAASILFVDDNEATRHSLACALQREGFATREAATGREALRLAAEEPDLVILDVGLPDMDGFEVCRRIKAHPATAATPVLHISGARGAAVPVVHVPVTPTPAQAGSPATPASNCRSSSGSNGLTRWRSKPAWWERRWSVAVP